MSLMFFNKCKSKKCNQLIFLSIILIIKSWEDFSCNSNCLKIAIGHTSIFTLFVLLYTYIFYHLTFFCVPTVNFLCSITIPYKVSEFCIEANEDHEILTDGNLCLCSYLFSSVKLLIRAWIELFWCKNIEKFNRVYLKYNRWVLGFFSLYGRNQKEKSFLCEGMRRIYWAVLTYCWLWWT